MIQQRTGDLLEIQEEGKFYYVVVLTKVVMFWGNIVLHARPEPSHLRTNLLR